MINSNEIILMEGKMAFNARVIEISNLKQAETELSKIKCDKAGITLWLIKRHLKS